MIGTTLSSLANTAMSGPELATSANPCSVGFQWIEARKLASLAPDQREAVVLRFSDELTFSRRQLKYRFSFPTEEKRNYLASWDERTNLLPVYRTDAVFGAQRR